MFAYSAASSTSERDQRVTLRGQIFYPVSIKSFYCIRCDILHLCCWCVWTAHPLTVAICQFANAHVNAGRMFSFTPSLVLENIFVQFRRQCFTNWSKTFSLLHKNRWNIWEMSANDYSGQNWLEWCLQLDCWDYVLWWSNWMVKAKATVHLHGKIFKNTFYWFHSD